MAQEIIQCNPTLCEFRFEAIEKSIDKIAEVNSSSQEQIQSIARAVDKIQVTYEQMAATLERLEVKVDEPKQVIVQVPTESSENRMWKLFEKLVIFLITVAGMTLGLNIK